MRIGVRETVGRLEARSALGGAPLGAFGQAGQSTRGVVGEEADVALEAAEPFGVVGGSLVPGVVTLEEKGLVGGGENVRGGFGWTGLEEGRWGDKKVGTVGRHDQDKIDDT